MNHVKSQAPYSPPILIQVRIDECMVDFEVDTGASVSLMYEAMFERLWPGRELHPTQVHLQAYTRELIPVVGCCDVKIHYEGH